NRLHLCNVAQRRGISLGWVLLSAGVSARSAMTQRYRSARHGRVQAGPALPQGRTRGTGPSRLRATGRPRSEPDFGAQHQRVGAVGVVVEVAVVPAVGVEINVIGI